jgi:hypothetical protein
MGDRLTEYQGLITGIPEHLNRSGNNQERSHKPKAKSRGEKRIATNADITSLTTGAAGLDFWS